MKIITALVLVILASFASAQVVINGGGGGSSGTPFSAAVGAAALYCADAGASDAYACNLSPAPSAYSDILGLPVTFKANTVNTGAATINFNSIGAQAIVKVGATTTTALVTNDIRAGSTVTVVWNGANFECTSCDGNRPSLAIANTWSQNNLFQASVYVDGTLYIGSTGNFGFLFDSTVPTPDSNGIVTDTTSNSWHLLDNATWNYDWQNMCVTGLGTVKCTNPTMVFHSKNQTAAESAGVTHDGKAFVIGAGNGTVLDGSFRLGGSVTLTESSATSVVTIPVAISTGTGGEIQYSVESRDATNTQVRRGTVRYSVANNSAGTETCGVYGVDNAATVNPAETNDGSGAGAITSGTLAYAWSSDTSGTNQCVLNINAVSSLTQTTLQIHYTVIQNGPGSPVGG